MNLIFFVGLGFGNGFEIGFGGFGFGVGFALGPLTGSSSSVMVRSTTLDSKRGRGRFLALGGAPQLSSSADERLSLFLVRAMLAGPKWNIWPVG